MSGPRRIQRSRQSGWSKKNAVIVDRTTKYWGNPFTVKDAIADEPGLTVLEARERCTWLLPEARFAYFAGCCWSLLRELGERARVLAEAREESWLDAYHRAVINVATMTWRESWMAKHGANPPAGLEDQVRTNALDLFPEYIRAADLLGAADLAAACKGVDLERYSEDLAEEEEDSFDAKIAKSYFLGWFDTGQEPLPDVTTAEWTVLTAYAWAAKYAGYEDAFIEQAAYFAGCRHDPATFSVSTLGEILDRDHVFVMERVVGAEGIYRDLAGYAQEAKAEADARAARVAAREEDPVPDFVWEAASLPVGIATNGGS